MLSCDNPDSNNGAYSKHAFQWSIKMELLKYILDKNYLTSKNFARK